MSEPARRHYLGVDAGGTSTRVLLTDGTGQRLRTAYSGGGNPTSRGRATAEANVSAAVSEVMHGIDGDTVDGVGLGVAGILVAGHEGLFETIWRDHHITCDITLESDAAVAFASGTPRPHGTVIIAGTGAVALGVRDHQLARRADGFGWLLGDLGSGFWLGQQAVHAALRHAAGIGPGGQLVTMVNEALLATASAEVDSLIHAAMDGEPVSLSRLAPLVTQAAENHDPVALSITGQAAQHLCHTASTVRDDGDDSPIVMAGSLLINDNAVSREVHATLRQRYPDASLARAHDGAAGAAWLAAATKIDDAGQLRDWHRHVTGR